MDRLKELEEQREKIKSEWVNINREIETLEADNLGVSGKYLYSKERGIYIHVSEAWLSPNDDKSERKIYLEGETLGFSEDGDESFLDWSLHEEIRSVFKNMWSDWIEISESKWKEVKKKAHDNFMKYDLRRTSEN